VNGVQISPLKQEISLPEEKPSATQGNTKYHGYITASKSSVTESCQFAHGKIKLFLP